MPLLYQSITLPCNFASDPLSWCFVDIHCVSLCPVGCSMIPVAGKLGPPCVESKPAALAHEAGQQLHSSSTRSFSCQCSSLKRFEKRPGTPLHPRWPPIPSGHRWPGCPVPLEKGGSSTKLNPFFDETESVFEPKVQNQTWNPKQPKQMDVSPNSHFLYD